MMADRSVIRPEINTCIMTAVALRKCPNTRGGVLVDFLTIDVGAFSLFASLSLDEGRMYASYAIYFGDYCDFVLRRTSLCSAG